MSVVVIPLFFLIIFIWIGFYCFEYYRFPSKELERILTTVPYLRDRSSTLHDSGPHRIPRRIFQTWKSKTNLPSLYESFSTTIRKMHPSFHYECWDDDDNLHFIETHYPEFLDTYLSYDVHIKRVDAIRYFYLYHFGGIYMDMDFVTLQPLETLLQRKTIVFGYQNKKETSIANAFMASQPRHPLFHYLITMLPHTKHLPVLEATGPVFLTKCVILWKLQDAVMKFGVLYTHEWNETPKIPLRDIYHTDKWKHHYPHAIATTVWTHTWK